MRLIISMVLIGIGVFLWFWGSFHLMGKRGFLWKIHALGIADSIGTFFILIGALVFSLENWPHVLLAIGAVVFWGTAFSFVLARLGKDQHEENGS